MSSGVLTSPMPPIATSRDPILARVKVENGDTGFYDGKQFRFIRELTAPIVYRFTSAVDFMLTSQNFSITLGEFRFYAWRSDNVTPSGTWESELFFRKNTVNNAYVSQVSIDSGGEIAVIDNELYADFEHLKTDNNSQRSATLLDGTTNKRFLSAGTYYLQFTGTADGSYSLEWEESP